MEKVKSDEFSKIGSLKHKRSLAHIEHCYFRSNKKSEKMRVWQVWATVIYLFSEVWEIIGTPLFQKKSIP